MSPERAIHSTSDLFGNLGHPPKSPKNTTPWSPEMAKSMAPMIAHIDAQKLKEEAERNTPEGRKKAAEAAEAEILRKRNRWATRAWALPLDGFKGIPDSAEDRELEIYTRTYDLEHKFWGIKPAGMNIWDFWDIYDPEVTRYHYANQETPATPEPATATPPLNLQPQRNKSKAKTRRRQRLSNTNSTHRVKKSTVPKVNKDTRKSLADKIDAENSGLEDQMRVVNGEVRARGRPIRKKTAVAVLPTEEERVKPKPSVRHDVPPQTKRPRGRPSINAKMAERRSNQKTTPLVQGKARITKAARKDPRPLAPSTHAMRTRRAGPAESIQLP